MVVVGAREAVNTADSRTTTRSGDVPGGWLMSVVMTHCRPIDAVPRIWQK